MKLLPYMFGALLISLFLCSCSIVSTQIDKDNQLPKDDTLEKQEVQKEIQSQVGTPPVETEMPLQNDITYTVASPTQEEIQEIHYRLEPIFLFCFTEYDSSTDNAYDKLFMHNHLDNVVPYYLEEVQKYIAKPFDETKPLSSYNWSKYGIPQNDPLGKFDNIPKELYDEDGSVDEYKAYQIDGLDIKNTVIGHNVFSANFIDWLIEGVWNGKVDYNIEIHQFDDGTQCYYHNGAYYTKETVGDRGGGGPEKIVIDEINQLQNNIYEIKFTIWEEQPLKNVVANIVLKETNTGFRFWSILNITSENFR